MNQYTLDRWVVIQGLPDASINAISQTPEGYLWIGTRKGLFRYNGTVFKRCNPLNDTTPTDLYINALYTDSRGNLWIGSYYGLIKYKNGEYEQFTKKDGLSSNQITTIVEDRHGHLWLGTSGGYLNYFCNGQFTAFDQTHGLDGKSISSIFESVNGNLWIGAYQNGLFRYNNKKFNRYIIPELKTNYSVNAIYEDDNGVLWIATNRGLISIKNPLASVNESRCIEICTAGKDLINSYINCFYKDQDGNMFMGTGFGLHRFVNHRTGKVLIEHGAPYNIILCLYEDREGSLWIGTMDAGLKRIRDAVFHTFSVSGSYHFPFRKSLFESSKGNIWIGNFVGTLYKYSEGKIRNFLQLDYVPECRITAIEEDASGDLWVGTISMGLYHIRGKNPVQYTKKNGLKSNGIRVILSDSKNKLWVGTIKGGVCIYDQNVFKSFPPESGLADGSVYNLYEDRKNNIWVGTNNGLVILKNGQYNPGTEKKYLPGFYITGIHEDNEGTMWIGTSGHGLHRLKNGIITSISVKNGLGSQYLDQILGDNLGNLWISSYNGVLRVNLAELNRFAKGRLKKINCQTFGTSDGMDNSECNFGAKNVAVKTRNNEFWFATRKGISIAHPKMIETKRPPVPVIIEKILFDNQSIPVNSKNRSFKGIRNIVFYFTTLTFLNPEKVKIRYKLEGVDPEWHIIGPAQEGVAYYNNPPPGKHTFKINTSREGTGWGKNETSFEFILELLFYQTLMFKIGLGCLALITGISLYYGIKKYVYFNKIEKKYKYSKLDPNQVALYLKKIQNALEIEKLYKDDSISIRSLSEKLSIPGYIVSQVINEKLNKNFRNLINGLRIEEAKRILMDPKEKNHTILSIAFEVGFNSKTVFNRTFKLFTGMTPTDYKNSKE
jgi:ligand-binding sensor domain-containing protein/AraC-like DNA-binding protein